MENRLQESEQKRTRRIWILLILAALVEILILIGLAFFIKTNMLVSLILALSFQIPLVIRMFATQRRVKIVCRLCSGLLLTSGIIVFLACYGRNYYIESMTVVDNNSVDTDRYLPFDEASAIARLDEEPELILTEDLPVLNGSAALFPLYSAVVNMVYPETIPDLNQKKSPFRYTNTEQAYKELLSGKTDIAFSEKPSEEILKSAEKKGVELELIPIGAEAFVFFNNRGNPVESLTQEQLRGIYSGRIVNWSEVGGDDVEIIAFQRNKGNGAQNRLEEFMGKTQLMESQQEYQLDTDDGITESASTYTNHKGAIGCSFLYYTRSMGVDKGLRLLAVDGVFPDNASVSSGEYPLSDKIYCAVVRGRVSENARKLLDWLTSAQGQRLVEEAGYTPK